MTGPYRPQPRDEVRYQMASPFMEGVIGLVLLLALPVIAIALASP